MPDNGSATTPEIQVGTNTEKQMTAAVTTEPAAKETPTLSTEARPAWLPAKFKTPEDLAKSYTELEKKLGSQPKPSTTTASGVASDSDQKTVDGQKADGSISAATTPSPLDLSALASAWAANGGSLPEAELVKLESAGISRAAVGQFIAGQQALAEQQTSGLAAVVGGKDQLDNVLKHFAGQNSNPTVQAYNKALAEGRITDAKLALREMNTTYTDRVGRDPRVIIKGEIAGGTNEPPFLSWSEVTTAMRDKRYETDKTYQRSVQRRVALSAANLR